MRLDLFGKIIGGAFALEHGSSLLCIGSASQNQFHGSRQALPLAFHLDKLCAALGCERIKARLAVVLADAPLGNDPLLVFETLKGQVEGAVVDEKHFLGLALDGTRDTLAVARAENERLQNEQVQGS